MRPPPPLSPAGERDRVRGDSRLFYQERKEGGYLGDV